MSPALLSILVVCLILITILFYVFIIRRQQDFLARGKAALLIIAFLIVPILGLTLWNQMLSKGRLAELGFVPYHGLGSSVGVLTGTGDQPMWLFTISETENAVLDFYKRTENRLGWDLVSENPAMLVFENSDSRLTLHVGDGTASFMLSHLDGETPN